MTTPPGVPRPLRSIGRVALVGVVGLGFGMAGPSQVLAECNPEGVPPSLEEAAATARLIVIGDVIAVRPRDGWDPNDGRSSQFTLAVRSVLRGQAPPMMSVEDVVIRPCVGLIAAKQGDRVVLMLDADDPAFSALPPGSTMRPATMNAVAWIAGQQRVGMDFVTEQEVRSLAGVGPSEPPASSADDASPWTEAALFVTAIVALVMLAFLARQRIRTA